MAGIVVAPSLAFLFPRARRLDWASPLKRTFKLDVLRCGEWHSFLSFSDSLHKRLLGSRRGDETDEAGAFQFYWLSLD